MELRRFADVDAFLGAAGSFLIEREAENNLIFGISGSARDTPEVFSGPPYLAVVADGDRVVAAALRTPPHRLILSEVAAASAVSLVAADTIEEDLPGVLGPVDVVRAFVDAWVAAGGPTPRLELAERSYRVTEVRPPVGVPGRWRPATRADRTLLVDWIHAFNREALDDDDRTGLADAVDRSLDGRGRSLFLWDDAGDAVSLCGVTGPTPNGIRIGPVYTPPAARRRGYASALVAAVSQAQLDAGRRFCFLFTDLANPTANRIYQAIGYEPVRDIEVYGFERS